MEGGRPRKAGREGAGLPVRVKCVRLRAAGSGGSGGGEALCARARERPESGRGRCARVRERSEREGRDARVPESGLRGRGERL